MGIAKSPLTSCLDDNQVNYSSLDEVDRQNLLGGSQAKPTISVKAFTQDVSPRQ